MRGRLLLAGALVALGAPGCAALGITGDCDGTRLIGIFEQVGDLVPGAGVQSSDVVIGSVRSIELDGWNARVDMCIHRGERLFEDSELVVRTTSLLGEKFVEIRPGEPGTPLLEDGAVLDTDRTSKATELEEIFARLAAVLGTGNLEQLNRFTAAQAEILRGNEGELRSLLRGLRRFTGVLAERKDDIASAVDDLDAVARTVLGDSRVLEDFLDSFARSAAVLNRNTEGMRDLLVSLDRFSAVTIRLLDSTQADLDRQLRGLRPVLRTLAANSDDLAASLRTLATFTQWFPETMPGDYLQLDVCQAPPGVYAQGVTCEQSLDNDDPGSPARNDLETILRRPLGGVR